MPTAARMMTRKVYKRASLGNELLQVGDAPIKGRYSWACITGELDRNKGHWFGLIKAMSFWATESMNRTATMKQNERKHTAAMAKIHPRSRDDRWAEEWLAEHSQKAKPKPKPKRQPLERWEIRLRAQKQERRAMTKRRRPQDDPRVISAKCGLMYLNDPFDERRMQPRKENLSPLALIAPK